VRIGLVIILAGIGGMTTVLNPAVPVLAGLAAWSLAGLGMGVGYAPTTLMMLREAPPGREGWASASLNLADVLGTATGIGVGGAAVAASASLSHGHGLRAGVATAFVISALAALAALGLAGRLPAGLISPEPSVRRQPAPVAEAADRLS
jgi:MFS family permease